LTHFQNPNAIKPQKENVYRLNGREKTTKLTMFVATIVPKRMNIVSAKRTVQPEIIAIAVDETN
jgi:hypothetical protein